VCHVDRGQPGVRAPDDAPPRAWIEAFVSPAGLDVEGCKLERQSEGLGKVVLGASVY